MTESRADIRTLPRPLHPRMMPNFERLKNRYIFEDNALRRVVRFAEWPRIRGKRHKPLRGLRKLVRPSHDWLNHILFQALG